MTRVLLPLVSALGIVMFLSSCANFLPQTVYVRIEANDFIEFRNMVIKDREEYGTSSVRMGSVIYKGTQSTEKYEYTGQGGITVYITGTFVSTINGVETTSEKTLTSTGVALGGETAIFTISDVEGNYNSRVITEK